MHIPGDDQDPNPVDQSSESNDDAPTGDEGVVTPLHANRSDSSSTDDGEKPTDLSTGEASSVQGETEALRDYAAKLNTPDAPSVIPVVRQNLPQEFWGFIVHNKAWWMTPIILVLGFMVGFILMAESTPVLPFIYTVL